MYKVTIKESNKELSARERIKIKDTTNAIKLDGVDPEEKLVFAPDYYAILEIENDKADTKDKKYNQFIVVDKSGTKYVTGSKSFWDSFINIYNEMKEETEPYEIEVYKMPTKNYTGKYFITCSIV